MLYWLVLLKLLYYSIYYQLYFGANSIVYSQPVTFQGILDFAYLLYGSSSTLTPAIFIAICLLCISYTLLLKKFSFLPDLLTWFCMLNLQNKIYPTVTGGDFLMNQFLLLNCFLSFRDRREGYLSGSRRLLHNLACICLLIQICFIYLFAGVAKLSDAAWLNGTAMVTISQIDYFSWWRPSAFAATNLVLKVITWLVMIYQLAFPLLMWLPRLKRPLLLVGILMHLYISFVLGLFQFGLAMIAAYVFLWPSESRNHLK